MTYRKVLLFWLPLALSWLLMTFESLWIQGVIGRKPDAETQLAAFGLMFSLSVLIETPVIMLLATSNALSRDRQSFRTLWRFMMAVNMVVTAVAILMAFTPLLDLYLGALLNVPGHIIEATRPGMKIHGLLGRFHRLSAFSPRDHYSRGQDAICRGRHSPAGARFRQRRPGAGRYHGDCRRSRGGDRFNNVNGNGDALHLCRLASRGQALCLSTPLRDRQARAYATRRPAVSPATGRYQRHHDSC